MATGLSLPLRADNGRAALSTGEEQLKKVIMLAIADCDSGNPYQDLGIDQAIVFSMNDDQTKAYAKRRIVDAFRRLEVEGRAQLIGAPTFTTLEGGSLECQIKYLNIETNEAQDITLRGAGAFEMFRSLTQGVV